MKITGIRLGTISAPLRTPFITALRRADDIRDVLIEVQTDDGAVGYGEAPPTAVITGDTTESIRSAIANWIAPAITGRDVRDLEEVLSAIQGSLVHNSSAKAAADMAVYDLFGQYYQIPVHRLLGSVRREIKTDLTISAREPEVMAEDAVRAVRRGFDCLKLKVGVDPKLDVARLSAVREAVGDEVCIRIDANQAWKPAEAVRILNAMQEQGLGLELVEQPVPARDLEGLAYVRQHSYVPVMADEAAFGEQDVLRILQMHAADMVNIKLMKCGGIYPATKIAALCDVYGVECMIGCMLETKVSVNAAAAFACGQRCVVRADLDGPGLCAEEPSIGGADFNEQLIVMNEAPGLGITGFKDGYVSWDS